MLVSFWFCTMGQHPQSKIEDDQPDITRQTIGNMKLSSSHFVLCSAAVALASPFLFGNETQTLERRLTLTSRSTGTIDGCFYDLWVQTASGVTMTIGAGTYNLTWTASAGEFVAGIGWMPGKAQTVTYIGAFNPGGNSYLCLYGWTTNPLVEYYICDNFGTYNPATGATHKGTVSSDGSTYDIYRTVRINVPSISGTATFNQYWSVRQNHRTGGTINTGTHFNAWKNLGMTMGSFNYQILATAGNESSGSSSITISSSGGSFEPSTPKSSSLSASSPPTYPP
ncbi:hypothetical protein D9619_003888 [Psilocybe cf. subviscida]|uniref:Endo-1,4-beta-xylanase n=1 Tax=Psilocybe cf. subviscida TaxID=2480587 RepID=A0A8H5BQM0_9AGAR|nr:hypothetical protein D9619_003888 [Psilocybe cf. subviscida]